MKRTIFYFLVFLLFFSSCNQNRYDLDRIADGQYTPDVASALLHTKFTTQDIIDNVEAENTSFEVNNQLITLIYQSDVFSQTATELFDVREGLFSGASPVGVTIASLPVGFTQDVDLSQTMPVEVGVDVAIDSAFFKNGLLSLEGYSELQQDLILNVTIPEISKDGEVFQTSLEMTYEGTVPIEAEFELSLQDFKLDLTENPLINTLSINIIATIIGTGNPVNATDSIGFFGSLTDVVVRSLYGDINDVTLPFIKDSIEITISEQIEGFGDFTVLEPAVDVRFINSYGFPMNTYFARFEGRNLGTNNVIDIASSSQIPNPLVLNYPVIQDIGSAAITEHHIEGSDITDFFNLKPNLFYYEINPFSTPNIGGQSFLIDTSRITINTKVSIPFYGNAEIFSLSDSLAINLAEDYEEDQVDNVTLLIVTENELPIDFFAQIYLADDGYTVIDSLFDQQALIIGSASVNDDGTLKDAYKNTLEIDLDNGQVDNLLASKNIIISGSAKTYDHPDSNIKILNNSALELTIGARVALKNIQ